MTVYEFDLFGVSTPLAVCYANDNDGDDADAGDANTDANANDGDDYADVKFTDERSQKRVNFLMAKERRQAEKRAAAKYEAQLAEKNKEIELAGERYNGLIVDHSISHAVSNSEAVDDGFLAEYLRSRTSLIEATDEFGKPTGEGRKPAVTIDGGYDSGGRKITKTLSPQEAVQYLRGTAPHLFKARVAGGLGAGNNVGGGRAGGRLDVTRMSSDEYSRVRREAPHLLGLKKSGR